MLVYNVTVKLEPSVVQDWLGWMKTTHIKDVMQTGYFLSSELFEIQTDDQDGRTFSVQYRCEHQGALNSYFKEHALALQAEHKNRYEGKYVAFRTILKKC